MSSLSGLFVVRTMRWEGMTLVNVCDEELLGTTVKDNQMEMHISQDYFGEELVEEDAALKLVQSSSVANLAGQRIVAKVLEAKLASGEAVKRVGDVSFLMIFKF